VRPLGCIMSNDYTNVVFLLHIHQGLRQTVNKFDFIKQCDFL